jgi:hypothetical protein
LTVFPQETTTFQTSLSPDLAIPQNNSTRVATGIFTLNLSLLFNGSIGVFDYTGISSATIFQTTSQSAAGTPVFDLTPGPIVIGVGGSGDAQFFEANRIITASEAADLHAGFWWISVITPAFPNGEIRGQITAIPEPETYVFLAVGTAALWLVNRRKREYPTQSGS